LTQLPKVSIITVVYNGASVIEKTIQSVIAQTYPNIEFLIIDGKSKDNTLAIVERYRDQIVTVISEPDNGIYDAMNKGIQYATGDYLWFMNAGDLIPEPETLAKAFETADHADVVYGETLMMNEDYAPTGLRTYKKLPENLTWRSMRYGMVVCHQSIIVRKSIAPLYDLKHRYSADIDWTTKVLKKAKKVHNAHLILSKFVRGGFSTEKRYASWIDRFKIIRKHFGLLTAIWVHIEILFQYLIGKMTGKR